MSGHGRPGRLVAHYVVVGALLTACHHGPKPEPISPATPLYISPGFVLQSQVIAGSRPFVVASQARDVVVEVRVRAMSAQVVVSGNNLSGNVTSLAGLDETVRICQRAGDVTRGWIRSMDGGRGTRALVDVYPTAYPAAMPTPSYAIVPQSSLLINVTFDACSTRGTERIVQLTPGADGWLEVQDASSWGFGWGVSGTGQRLMSGAARGGGSVGTPVLGGETLAMVVRGPADASASWTARFSVRLVAADHSVDPLPREYSMKMVAGTYVAAVWMPFFGSPGALRAAKLRSPYGEGRLQFISKIGQVLRTDVLYRDTDYPLTRDLGGALMLVELTPSPYLNGPPPLLFSPVSVPARTVPPTGKEPPILTIQASASLSRFLVSLGPSGRRRTTVVVDRAGGSLDVFADRAIGIVIEGPGVGQAVRSEMPDGRIATEFRIAQMGRYTLWATNTTRRSLVSEIRLRWVEGIQ